MSRTVYPIQEQGEERMDIMETQIENLRIETVSCEEEVSHSKTYKKKTDSR